MSCLSSESGNQPIVLGPNILLFLPPQQSAPDSAASQQPSVIILCTWLGGATERRVRKYNTGYRALYQYATILVIRTVLMDLTIRSFAAIRSRLAPAREAISSILQGAQNEDGPRKTALLHMFSHRGCNTAIQLMASMSSEERASLHECLRLVVFDCCPGDASFGKAYEAGLLSLPPQMPFRSHSRIRHRLRIHNHHTRPSSRRYHAFRRRHEAGIEQTFGIWARSTSTLLFLRWRPCCGASRRYLSC